MTDIKEGQEKQKGRNSGKKPKKVGKDIRRSRRQTWASGGVSRTLGIRGVEVRARARHIWA